MNLIIFPFTYFGIGPRQKERQEKEDAEAQDDVEEPLGVLKAPSFNCQDQPAVAAEEAGAEQADRSISNSSRTGSRRLSDLVVVVEAVVSVLVVVVHPTFFIA